MIYVKERGPKQKCFRRRRKVDRDGAETTLSGRLLQMVGLATVDSLTDGSLPADDWSEHSGGNVDQADRRHEPVDSGMTEQFHEWPCTRARPSSPSIGSGLRRDYECVRDAIRVTLAVDEPCCREYHLPL